MRKTWLVLLVIAGLLVGLLGPLATASAAPQMGYAAGTMFTKDPEDPDTQATSFETTDKMVVAWFFGKATEGSPAQDFEFEIEFYTPSGAKYASKWYDDGKVTLSDPPAKDSTARKYVEIAGTDAAKETGEWSVKFYVGAKLFKIESFTLVGGKGPGPDIITDVKAYLEEQGYKVYFAEQGEFSSGGTYAYVRMDMASEDLYSSEVSNQLYHAFYALRTVYPDDETLVCGLMFSSKYEVVFFARATDWDTFYQGGKWEDFAKGLQVAVFDRETGKALATAETKNFITKNFGTGATWTPPNVKVKRDSGAVSSVKVEVTPYQLPADGKSVADVQVTVYDKDNQPLGNVEVEFTLSGAAAQGCRIRPTITSTNGNGEAEATFTAGTTNGTVNITAKAKSATGVAVVTIGSGDGDKDPKVGEITAFLSKYGYKVHGAGYLTDQQGNKTGAVAVVMDMASNTFDNVLGQQLVLGWLVLYQAYPDAQALYVILYYDRYALFFGTTPADLAAALKAGDAGDAQTVEAFWTKVFTNLVIVDRTTGERVTDTRGFIQKNFTKGSSGGFDLAPPTAPWSMAPPDLAAMPWPTTGF